MIIFTRVYLQNQGINFRCLIIIPSIVSKLINLIFSFIKMTKDLIA